MAQSYGKEKFKQGILLLDELDMKIRDSATDPCLLAEMLMIRLTERS